MQPSRRDVLRFAGTAAGLAATAGCLSFGTGQSGYQLLAHDLEDSLARQYLIPDPTDVRAETRVDYTSERKSGYVETLLDTGSVTALQWPLTEYEYWGDHARPRPAFLRHEGTFYHVRVAETMVDRDRWVFGFERADEPDGDAAVAMEPFGSLSDADRRVVEAALDAIYAGSDGFLGTPDFDEQPVVQFHDGLDPAASDLVPEPPFDFVEYAEDYYRPFTDQRTVTVPERTFSLEAVGDSWAAIEEYVESTVPDARFSEVSLSSAARDVLDTAVDPEEVRGYLEDPPLSDGLSSVLGALGIEDHLRPYDEYETRTVYPGAVAEYRGTWYEFELQVEV
ncbi:twin-arginine translocation signal domain-containing protein [Haloarchaeobius amylolyticus]|uniref:twin-arginine translocation signal domain-containing protein n=1 Tax=Haloarchaeobius amylolyticus TaxID=1198296 RepID=UPI002271E9D1|nr:twin-arginine translocation signal domain-containing protein [Haloarchaeobius amylolyticus]